MFPGLKNSDTDQSLLRCYNLRPTLIHRIPRPQQIDTNEDGQQQCKRYGAWLHNNNNRVWTRSWGEIMINPSSLLMAMHLQIGKHIFNSWEEEGWSTIPVQQSDHHVKVYSSLPFLVSWCQYITHPQEFNKIIAFWRKLIIPNSGITLQRRDLLTFLEWWWQVSGFGDCDRVSSREL